MARSFSPFWAFVLFLSLLAGQANAQSASNSLPLNNSWIVLDQYMNDGDFFTGSWSWTSSSPVVFQITDLYVASDQFQVYDNGVLVKATPSFPDWDELGASDPFDPSVYASTPDLALALGIFSNAVIVFPPGTHVITITDIHIPPEADGLTFPDGTVAFRATLPTQTLTLTEATTLDAQSVTVDYTLSQDTNQPLEFDIYRSDTPDMDAKSQFLGTQSIAPATDAADLQQGSHEVTLIPGTPLPPNPALPFVVVVATSGDSAIEADPASAHTTYFHKYLLGGVVHGFAFPPFSATLAWMAAMQNDLMNVANFDLVITHQWLGDSVTPLPGLATAAGDDMNYQLTSAAIQLLEVDGHPGDVVDLHLFGHSRGTVVVSQVLQDMAADQDPTWSGSYVEATLLDIHPANPQENNLLDFRSRFLPLGWISAALVASTRGFQDLAQDPEIVLPSEAGLMAVDIWSQHTPASSFPLFSSEDMLNLWGESEADNHITNDSGVVPQWHDLTSLTYFLNGQRVLIGHAEVHEYYRLFQIDSGFVH